MAEWIECGDRFIGADVIRWTEAVWENRRGRSGKAAKIGERRVIAEVLREPNKDGWVRLLVRACEVISDKQSRPFRRPKPLELKKGDEIKRQRKTLVRGKPERLPWSDESARGIAASKFLGNREPAFSASKEQDDN